MLVERLAQEIADLVLASEPRVEEVDVTIEKPGALRHARSVGISIHRSRVEER
jgi:dihydroneopterin aldolase/D-erythro-7,8-dihydroneopterin triphosphate epimerase